MSTADYPQYCTVHVAFAIRSKPYNSRVTAVDTQPNLLHTVGITSRVLSIGEFEFDVFWMCAVLGHEGMASSFTPELPTGRQCGDGALTHTFFHQNVHLRRRW